MTPHPETTSPSVTSIAPTVPFPFSLYLLYGPNAALNFNPYAQFIRTKIFELGLDPTELYCAFREHLLGYEQRKACGYPIANPKLPSAVEFFNDSFKGFSNKEGIRCGVCQQHFYAASNCPCPRRKDGLEHVPLKVVVSDTEKFVKTRMVLKPKRNVLAMDCEMCVTTKGLEVTKVSLISVTGRQVYDKFVKPDNPILNYNSKYSGIYPYHLADVKTRLCDVQEDLLRIIDSCSIIVGHALENDFKALRLTHSLVVDTSVEFPDARGLPFKRSLKNVVKAELKIDIQNDPFSGHDSLQDAYACIMLMLQKLKLNKATLLRIMGLCNYYEPMANWF